jgi:pimeloyl-ACP methyl ester carboxylesterase
MTLRGAPRALELEPAMDGSTWLLQGPSAGARSYLATRCAGFPCDVLIAEGAGHWPHREAAPAFHERLLALLAGLP